MEFPGCLPARPVRGLSPGDGAQQPTWEGGGSMDPSAVPRSHQGAAGACQGDERDENPIAPPIAFPKGGDPSARRTTRTKRLETIETPVVTERNGGGARDRNVMITVPAIARRSSESCFYSEGRAFDILLPELSIFLIFHCINSYKYLYCVIPNVLSCTTATPIRRCKTATGRKETGTGLHRRDQRSRVYDEGSQPSTG